MVIASLDGPVQRILEPLHLVAAPGDDSGETIAFDGGLERRPEGGGFGVHRRCTIYAVKESEGLV
jgi:hypothetical protein